MSNGRIRVSTGILSDIGREAEGFRRLLIFLVIAVILVVPIGFYSIPVNLFIVAVEVGLNFTRIGINLIWTTGGNGLVDIVNGLGAGVEGLINSVIGAVNGLIATFFGGLNAFACPPLSPVPGCPTPFTPLVFGPVSLGAFGPVLDLLPDPVVLPLLPTGGPSLILILLDVFLGA